MPSLSIKHDIGSEEVSYDVLLGDSQMPEESLSDVSDAFVASGDFNVTILELISILLGYKLVSVQFN